MSVSGQIFQQVDSTRQHVWWLETRALEIEHGITVVIPACNEQLVIGETLDWLGRHLTARDRVHVIADHCQDETARIACAHGAIVHVRMNEAERGKGAALRWWLEQTRTTARENERVLILDADSQIAPDMISRLRPELPGGDVIQVRIAPLVASSGPIAQLAGLSEVVEQRIKDALRARLRWPVRLRGTGMLVPRDILARFSGELHTYVEDLELTLLMAAAGISIRFLDETYVADPKPLHKEGVEQQRARWFRGQIEVLCKHPGAILRLFTRGIPGWSLLSSMFFRPKTIVQCMQILVALGCTFMGLSSGGFWRWLSAIFNVSIIWELGLHLYGLRYVPDRREMLLALLQIPGYLLMWLRSVLVSLTSGKKWLRGRPL